MLTLVYIRGELRHNQGALDSLGVSLGGKGDVQREGDLKEGGIRVEIRGIGGGVIMAKGEDLGGKRG